MRTVLTAALGYAALVFVAGFLLGTLRVLRVAPRIGALAAVASEVPVMVALSWLAARAVLARRPLPRRTARLAMGALAFALLMLAEAALALALGQRLSEWARTMTTAPGALGLAGQVAFALIPSFLPKYPRG